MEKTYIVGAYLGTLKDAKAAIDLIKESGGKVLGMAPKFMGGVICSASEEIGDALRLITWN